MYFTFYFWGSLSFITLHIPSLYQTTAVASPAPALTHKSFFIPQILLLSLEKFFLPHILYHQVLMVTAKVVFPADTLSSHPTVFHALTKKLRTTLMFQKPLGVSLTPLNFCWDALFLPGTFIILHLKGKLVNRAPSGREWTSFEFAEKLLLGSLLLVGASSFAFYKRIALEVCDRLHLWAQFWFYSKIWTISFYNEFPTSPHQPSFVIWTFY